MSEIIHTYTIGMFFDDVEYFRTMSKVGLGSSFVPMINSFKHHNVVVWSTFDGRLQLIVYDTKDINRMKPVIKSPLLFTGTVRFLTWMKNIWILCK